VRTVPRVARRVRSFVEQPPGAELLGTVVGSPWTEPSAWLDRALSVRLLPDAVRFAWRLTGQRSRVAIAAEFVSCGAQPCAVCNGDCYTHGPFFFEYRYNEGGGVERASLERLARRSPPPTLADVSLVATRWREHHEAQRAEQRWRAAMHEQAPWARGDRVPGWGDVPPPPPRPDVRGGPRADFRTGPGFDFRSSGHGRGGPPPHWHEPGPYDNPGPRAAPRPPPGEQRERLEQLAADMKLLGLGRGFTQDDLKKAHRKLALELHPDRGGDPEKAKQVNAAHQRLLALFEDPPMPRDEPDR
jgi:hypothetical protein